MLKSAPGDREEVESRVDVCSAHRTSGLSFITDLFLPIVLIVLEFRLEFVNVELVGGSSGLSSFYMLELIG